MVERFNRTLDNQMAIFVEKHMQKNWDEQMPLLLLFYRTAVHESTKQTPPNLMFGRKLTLSIDLLYGRPPGQLQAPSTLGDYVSKLRKRLEDIHEFSRLRIRVASGRMKRRYNVKIACSTSEQTVAIC